MAIFFCERFETMEKRASEKSAQHDQEYLDAVCMRLSEENKKMGAESASSMQSGQWGITFTKEKRRQRRRKIRKSSCVQLFFYMSV